jgi:hypothetical protein
MKKMSGNFFARKHNAEKKTKFLRVNVTADLRKKVFANAKIEGVSVSELFRQMINFL